MPSSLHDAVAFEAWASELLREGTSESALTRTIDEGVRARPLYGPGPAPFGEGGLPTSVRGSGSTRAGALYRGSLAEVLADVEADGQAGLESAFVELRDEDAETQGIVQGLAELVAKPVSDDCEFVIVTRRADGPSLAAVRGAWLARHEGAAQTADARLAGVLYEPVSAWLERAPDASALEVAEARVLRDLETRVASKSASRTLLVCGASLHDAGASPVAELAGVVAQILAWLRWVDASGRTADELFSAIVVRLAVDTDLLVSVAKLRAMRLLCARVAAHCGSEVEVRLDARTSLRVHARRDPWMNLLRGTLESTAGLLAGVASLCTVPFDALRGEPTALGRGLALATTLVLREESHLGRVHDPLGGSFYVEQLTHDLAEAAWTKVRAILARGGFWTVLADGTFTAELRASYEAELASYAEGRRCLTGVTRHVARTVVAVPRTEVEAADPRSTLASRGTVRSLAMTLEDRAAAAAEVERG